LQRRSRGRTRVIDAQFYAQPALEPDALRTKVRSCRQLRKRVYGTLEFRDTAPIGWTGAWRTRWQNTDYAGSISAVNFDTAFNTIVAGVIRVASRHGAPA
jgi:hypothetical protein